MCIIDIQRVAAVRKLEELGYIFANGEWVTPAGSVAVNGAALHVRLVMRAEELAGCADGSDEARELNAVGAAIEAYEET